MGVKRSKRTTQEARLDRRTRTARAEGREAREELLAAALRVFARRGYRQAGVAEIAAAAGYSKGALYWHFSGKEELLATLLEEQVDAPTRELVALLETAPPDRDMSAEDLARIVMGVMGGLATDELIEPGSVRAELPGDALALIYAGLVARAQD